ncbi:MAG: tRNA preQ1(34) S-adenosylmethionine ribosyltransferase-isomerase QueA [Chloroflexi bacterium]|nr:tRNA preQ1(34) S-adenosylmethionine ribosyltransferase-isomerase QueA [Chloroflexota bacterium]
MASHYFDYPLPTHLVAQTPQQPRDRARLLALRRGDGSLEHRLFHQLGDCLHPGDVLVANDSRVIPARLWGRKEDTGGRVEMLLLRSLDDACWEALARPARRLRAGMRIVLEPPPGRGPPGSGDDTWVEVLEGRGEGIVILRFPDKDPTEKWGAIPLPPYIHQPLSDPEQYQTVYARARGSVAAPTAGLHFTLSLMKDLEKRGIPILFVTLHVGQDTFRPVARDGHHLHQEWCSLSPEVAHHLTQARLEKRRIVAVGTTTVRVLEEAGRRSGWEAGKEHQPLHPFDGWADLFIQPGYAFKVVDGLITNFHLPRSTPLLLTAAFAGEDYLQRAYLEAIERGYRFYSLGDAMLIV